MNRRGHLGRWLVVGTLAVCWVGTAPAADDFRAYQEKPAWWDTLGVKEAAPNLTNPTLVWEALSAANQVRGTAYSGWELVGPFAAPDARALDVPYPPETDEAATEFPSRSGGTIRWVQWPADAARPVPNVAPNALFYARRNLEFPEATTGFFTITAEADVRVWLDRQPLDLSQRILRDRIVPIKVAPGTHRLLVKVLQTGPGWSFRVGWMTRDPRMLEIRLRTMVCQRAGDDPIGCRNFLWPVPYLYGMLDDAPNAQLMLRQYLDREGDAPHLRAVVGDVLLPQAARSYGLAQVYYTELGRAALRATGEVEEQLIYYYLALAAQRLDVELAGQWVKDTGVKLRPEQAAQFVSLRSKVAKMDLLPWVTAIALRDDPKHCEAFFTAEIAKSDEDERPAFFTGIEEAIKRGSPGDPQRLKALLGIYVRLALSQGDTERARLFLERNRTDLSRVMPLELARWELDLAMAQANVDAAGAALGRAIQADAVFARSPTCEQLRFAIYEKSKGRDTFARVLTAEDSYAGETVQNHLRMLERSGKPLDLHRFIRETLTEKAGRVVASDRDPRLFRGAKATYRQMFLPNRGPYDETLQRRLAVLEQDPLTPPAVRAFRRASAALTLPALAVAPQPPLTPVAGVRELPAGLAFRPLVELPPGPLENDSESTRAEVGALPQPWLRPPPAVDGEGRVLVQNSRAVAALLGDVVQWTYVAPAVPFASAARTLAGEERPAVVGDVVAARLLLPETGLALVGLDRRTGVRRWQWAEPGYEPASPATVVNETELVFLANHGLEVVLIGVVPTTGETVFRLPLVAGARALATGALSIDSSRSLPPPSVADGVAFVDTGRGAIAAVDLADASLKWVRVYLRRVGRLGLAERVPCPPVVGKANVLFSPADGTELLLVNRATGALVAEKTAFPCVATGPWGDDGATVLTVSNTYFYSLQNLGPKKLPKRQRYVAPLADGCLLAQDWQLRAFDATGTAQVTMDLPPGFQPTARIGDRLYGYHQDRPGTFGVLAPPGPVPTLPTLAAPAVSVIREPAALATADGALLWGSGLLTAVDPEGRRRWDLPIARGAGLFSQGGKLAILQHRRLYVYGEGDGRLLGVWPPAQDTTKMLAYRAAAGDGQWYALTASAFGEQPECEVYRFGPDLQATRLGVLAVPLAKVDQFFVLPGGQAVVAGRREAPAWAGLFVADAAGGRCRQTREWVERPAPLGLFAYPAGPGAAIHDAAAHKAWLCTGAEVREFMPAAAGIFTRAQGKLWVAEPAGQRYVFDPATGKGLAVDEAGLRWWAPWGEDVVGLKCPPEGNVVVPVRADLGKSGTLTAGQPLPQPPIGEESPAGGDVVAGGRLFEVLRQAADSALAHAVVWSAGVAPEVVQLPALRARITDVSDRLMLVGDVPCVKDDFLAGLRLSNAIRTAKLSTTTAARPAVDGFLDEWEPSEFQDLPTGRLAVRLGANEQEVWFALELTDAKVIESFGAAGLDDRLFVVVRPGVAAGFDADPAAGWGANQRLSSRRQEAAWQFAYTVTPDATRCTLELYCGEAFPLPPKDVPAAEWAAQRIAAGARWGEVALRLLYRSDADHAPVNLGGPPRWGPLSYVRWRWERPAPK